MVIGFIYLDTLIPNCERLLFELEFFVFDLDTLRVDLFFWIALVDGLRSFASTGVIRVKLIPTTKLRWSSA